MSMDDKRLSLSRLTKKIFHCQNQQIGLTVGEVAHILMYFVNVNSSSKSS